MGKATVQKRQYERSFKIGKVVMPHYEKHKLKLHRCIFSPIKFANIKMFDYNS